MKLTLLNVKYSPNLGDGIIAECFEHALAAAPGVEAVNSCDLAGRTHFDKSSNRFRQTIRSFLDHLPSSIRRFMSIAILRQLVSSKLRAHFARELDGADVAIIGGGQLIADAELNFPIKIYEASRTARENGAAIAVHGVGVGAHFSRKGKELFQAAFEGGLASVQVRDQRSANRWAQNFGTTPVPQVWDPGLLSSQVYGMPERPSRSRKLIGIGITQPATLNLHSDSKTGLMTKADWLGFYVGLAEYCIARDCDVELFTNGAFNDQIFAGQIVDQLKRNAQISDRVSLAAALQIPEELAHLISSYDAIVAHRLHANIIAYSYAIPHVGLGWDTKMEGFFEATSRDEFLISSFETAAAEQVGRTLFSALDVPIARSDVDRLQAEASAQISALATTLQQFVARPAKPGSDT